MKRLISIATILALGAVFWLARQRGLNESRRQLVDLEQSAHQLNADIFAVRNSLRITRAKDQQEKMEQTKADQTVATARKAIASAQPDSFRTEPPASRPDWDPASPYIWLTDYSLTNLPIEAFEKSGSLSAEIAELLGITGPVLRALNMKLGELLREYQDAEVAHVQATNGHLPGIAESEGPKVTIQVFPQPEAGARLKAEFERLLQDTLGDRRTQIVLGLAESWIDNQFGQSDSEPQTISLSKSANGIFKINLKRGGSWISTGAPSIQDYVPPHLLPFFAGLENPGSTASSIASQPEPSQQP